MSKKVFIIAEAGVNHNGDLDLAKKLVIAAANAGADAVKFQTFKTENLVTVNAEKADYQKETTGKSEKQFQMLKKLELPFDWHVELSSLAKSHGIQFLSTPFDHESATFLNELGIEIFKIPSGEITNFPYLKQISQFGKEIIISTGISYLSDIERALMTLERFGTARSKITVLHCTSEYPAPIESTNLRAMESIRESMKVKVGYSDHTTGIEVPIAAVAMGAEVIEKHFTLDKNMIGPDHLASLDPVELKQMVDGIRKIEKALGDGIKRPSQGELKNSLVARKSLVASRPIKAGDFFTEENMVAKRPGTGVNPMEWERYVGLRKATRDYQIDEVILD